MEMAIIEGVEPCKRKVVNTRRIHDPVLEPGTPKPTRREPPDAPPPREDPPTDEPPRQDPENENLPIKVEVPS